MYSCTSEIASFLKNFTIQEAKLPVVQEILKYLFEKAMFITEAAEAGYWGSCHNMAFCVLTDWERRVRLYKM